MSLLSKLFGKKKEPEKAEEDETKPVVSLDSSEPLVIGVLSGKGGCGKSTISANMTVLIAALYKKVIAVDMDVVNGSLGHMLSYPLNDADLREIKASTLEYIVRSAQEYSLLELQYPPNKKFTIRVANKKGVGVVARGIYFLPAKRRDPSYDADLKLLSELKHDEIHRSISELYSYIIGVARKHGIKHVIFDFPPLGPDERRGARFEGVFSLLEQIPKFILVSSFDFSAIHGLVSLINQNYSYIKPRVLGFLINMAIDNEEAKAKIRQYIEKIYGRNTVYFIRRSKWWTITEFPPIILDDPSRGANFDLIYALTKLGIIRAEDVEKKLGFNPLEGEKS